MMVLDKKYRSYVFCLLACLLIYFVFYFHLGSYPLSNNNEGLYAEVAREMLEQNKWIIPQLNYVPYIEKPPLLYWFIAFSFKVFGVNEFAARFIPATSVVLTVFSFFLFLNHLQLRKEANLFFLVAITSVGLIGVAHTIIFDSLLMFFFTASLLSFFLWWKLEKRSYLFLFYIFLAFALLTKGFVSIVLVGAIVFFFLLWEKTFLLKIKAFLDPFAILLFLMLVCPWHILASIYEDGFAWFYFINEHILRFLDLRVPKDYYTGPIYYHLIRVFVMIFPWFFFLPYKKSHMRFDAMTKFFMLCFFVPFVFFSLSKAKANYFMIIAVPFLLTFIAMRLLLLCERSMFKKISVAVFAFVLSAVLVSKVFFIDRLEKHSHKNLINSLPEDAKLVALYDYESFSSVLFYYGKRMPIIQYQSFDLLYGSQKKDSKDWFFETMIDLDSFGVKTFFVISKKYQQIIDNFVRKKNYRIYNQDHQLIILSK